ncbi:MAG: hypothetical protein ABL895_14935 [Cyclobacteriaceae bacterium]
MLADSVGKQGVGKSYYKTIIFHIWGKASPNLIRLLADMVGKQKRGSDAND